MGPMEEIYHVASGTGEIWVDDETKRVKQSNATWIPSGSRHSQCNIGKEELVILVVASPYD